MNRIGIKFSPKVIALFIATYPAFLAAVVFKINTSPTGLVMIVLTGVASLLAFPSVMFLSDTPGLFVSAVAPVINFTFYFIIVRQLIRIFKKRPMADILEDSVEQLNHGTVNSWKDYWQLYDRLCVSGKTII